MKILSIETSCDETAIALVKKDDDKKEGQDLDFHILSNVVASQVKLHQKYGGVYPSLAKREHQKNLTPVLKKALKQAGMLHSVLCSKIELDGMRDILKREEIVVKPLKKFLSRYKKPEIEAIAVTIGPGLEPCLWTGVNFAKALSYSWKLPIIPVNHIEAHIIANLLPQSCEKPKSKISNTKQIQFPAICLVVSGGHTQLILMKDFGQYKIIGETRDDAAGECFDKTARILGLPYPGGPAIAKQAQQGQAQLPTHFNIKLPRPMIYSKDYDFSFSGLKTAVLYDFKKRSSSVKKSKKYIQEMAVNIQESIIDVLIRKTIRAAKDFRARSIILGGGVTANQELRKQLDKRVKKEMPNTRYFMPSRKFSTDNAAMIGATAFWHLENSMGWKKVTANANLRVGDYSPSY